jgi:lactate permease
MASDLSRVGAEAWATAHKMRFAFLTVASMLALAYVMNLSGQTITIGTWIAGDRRRCSPSSARLLGWIGTAVTGSDTSANALFATLQQSAARPPASTRPCSSPPTPPAESSAR